MFVSYVLEAAKRFSTVLFCTQLVNHLTQKTNLKEEIFMQQRSNSSQSYLSKSVKAIIGSFTLIFLLFESVWAQDNGGGEALVGGAILLYLLLFAAIIGVYIWMLVWVNNDARSRGQSGCMPMLLVFIFGPIGLIIWLLMRPKN